MILASYQLPFFRAVVYGVARNKRWVLITYPLETGSLINARSSTAAFQLNDWVNRTATLVSEAILFVFVKVKLP